MVGFPGINVHIGVGTIYCELIPGTCMNTYDIVVVHCSNQFTAVVL